MKRTWIAGLLVLSMSGAVYTGAAESQGRDSNILIAYFSRVGNTDFPDNMDAVTSASLLKDGGRLYGNTQYVAAMIQRCTGGDPPNSCLHDTDENMEAMLNQLLDIE